VLNGMRVLIDETVSQDDLDTIRDTLEASKPAGVISYHRLRARRSGAVRHVDVHVVVDPQMTVAAAHLITDQIETSLEERLPSADVVVHVEPAGSEPEPDAHY
jgi:divalent metal cation (Fe/Co/Zn/Cd) transporter